MSYVSTCLADGAVGLYALGEALSSSPATDQAGIQNGTYGNTAGVTLGQTGIAGGGGLTACRLTAASAGFVQIADNASQHVGDTFTLEIWLKLATTGVQYGLLAGNTSAGPVMRINTTGVINVYSQGTADIGTSVATIADTTTFHHVVWTKATSTNHIYVDGSVSDGTFTNQPLINSAGWFIGVEAGSLDGTVAMAAMYPTAFVPGTVLNHYNLGAAVFTALRPPIVVDTAVARSFNY